MDFHNILLLLLTKPVYVCVCVCIIYIKLFINFLYILCYRFMLIHKTCLLLNSEKYIWKIFSLI